MNGTTFQGGCSSEDLKAAVLLVSEFMPLPSELLGLKHPSTDAHRLVARLSSRIIKLYRGYQNASGYHQCPCKNELLVMAIPGFYVSRASSSCLLPLQEVFQDRQVGFDLGCLALAGSANTLDT